jgi:Hsp70 protein
MSKEVKKDLSKKFVVGIDLGTSNCSVAVTKVSEKTEEEISVLTIAQVAGPGIFEEQLLLPSAIFIPTAEEFAQANFNLPWGKNKLPYVIGNYARERGVETPDRLVVSAKSWLSNSKVDRQAQLLPFQSESVSSDIRLSPFSASVEYLKHLHSAVAAKFSSESLIEVVVTVPASFDEVARKLTQDAASKAGFTKVTLLEEPIAAFYDWISNQGDDWRKQVAAGDIVLVCDVGGGTADFSLIAVLERDGELDLRRISVGDHILLGGDNIDLAIAHLLRGKLSAEGTAIDDWTFLSLVYQSRIAKEVLLSSQDQKKMNITLPNRGSDLFADPKVVEVSKEEIHQLVVDGFFPKVAKESKPKKARSSGLREIGLPFESDPALTAHLAGFLSTSLSRFKHDEHVGELFDSANSEDILVKPTAILFNGGVFKAQALRERILSLVSEWSGHGVKELVGGDLDLSVSKGACSYGYKKVLGVGWRIRSGTLKSYYIGIESSQLAVPGFPKPLKGLCILPKGAEEGSNFAILDLEFSLEVGEQVEFRLFTSLDRAEDRIGTIINDAERNLVEMAPIKSTIDFNSSDADFVNVRLNAAISETGVLQIVMQHTASEHEWNLELDVRATDSSLE